MAKIFWQDQNFTLHTGDAASEVLAVRLRRLCTGWNRQTAIQAAQQLTEELQNGNDILTAPNVELEIAGKKIA